MPFVFLAEKSAMNTLAFYKKVTSTFSVNKCFNLLIESTGIQKYSCEVLDKNSKN